MIQSQYWYEEHREDTMRYRQAHVRAYGPLDCDQYAKCNVARTERPRGQKALLVCRKIIQTDIEKSARPVSIAWRRNKSPYHFVACEVLSPAMRGILLRSVQKYIYRLLKYE